MSIPGVANVAIWGQRDRQLQVLVNPDRLRAHDLSIDDVVRAAGEGVSLQAGGFLDTPNQRLAVTHASAVRSTSDLESIVVAQRNGTALRIGDVATVVEGSPPPIGDGDHQQRSRPAADRREATRRRRTSGHLRCRSGAAQI